MGGIELKWHRGPRLSWTYGSNKRWYVARRLRFGLIPFYNVFARQEPQGEVVLFAGGFLTRGSAERWVANEDQFYKEKAL